MRDCVLFISFAFLYFGLFSGISAMRCAAHNATCGDNQVSCDSYVECEQPEPDKRAHCYVLWQNDTSGFRILQKGCWLNHASCYDKKYCIETRKDGKKNLLFCCCDGDMCNVVMYHNPAPVEATPLTPVDEKRVKMNDNEGELMKTLLCTLVPITVLTIIIVLLFWIYRRRRLSDFNEVPTVDPTTPIPPTPVFGSRPIQLIEIKARGRFGAVWKAQILSEHVAVKIFPMQDKSSWLVEQEVYQLPQMKHENILSFIGLQKKGENGSLQSEFWLITAFHEKGSLYDYLKANLLSWKDLCKIAESMTRGLMHLHEEMAANKMEGCKPSLAHRDFKSKNVLLKDDNTACIADLGLAVVFRSGESLSEAHGQVGTRRYMAPEVLEGAINFHRDSFLRIDMYACGLVLWELVSRCSIQDGPVDEYMLPFEEEVGQHPTLEDMQEAVVEKKFRPKIRESWRNNYLLSMICESIEECWDHDAEARLSASCIQERMAALPRTAVINISNHSNTGSRNSALSTSNHDKHPLISNTHLNFQPTGSSKESCI